MPGKCGSDTEQFEYPVEISDSHRVFDTPDYAGDRFECHTGAHMHTGAWPTWDFCPFCGGVLPDL
jgi:hypothetical protein